MNRNNLIIFRTLNDESSPLRDAELSWQKRLARQSGGAFLGDSVQNHGNRES